jgi:hypothetical protein
MTKKPIFLISGEGKSKEQVKREVRTAFSKLLKAQKQTELEEAEVYFVKAQKPKPQNTDVKK